MYYFHNYNNYEKDITQRYSFIYAFSDGISREYLKKMCDDKNNKFSIIKGWVLIINNVDKIIEKFVTNQKYICDSIDFFQVKDDNIDYSKYVSIIIYHSSKSYNIIETCKYLRKKGYNNVIIIVTFDLETNYNSYIFAGANIVFFHPIKPKELELLFS